MQATYATAICVSTNQARKSKGYYEKKINHLPFLES
jgi:hypothetical protein